MIKLFKKYASKASDTQEETFQKMLIMIISFFMCICGFVWAFMYYVIFGWGIIVIIAITYTIILSTFAIIGHYLKNHYILVNTLFVLTVALPASIQFIAGRDNSGMTISWCFMGALGSLIFLSVRQAIYWMMVFVAIVLYAINFDPAFMGERHTVTIGLEKWQYSMNMVVSYVVIFSSAAWFVKTIQFEKKRSESLLLNILPTEVAEELKKFGKVEPVNHDNCTVLFTDFKGFTEISESITAKELVAEINHCFGAFDEITSRYNIEKIKTIGDSYMAVGGNFSGFECTPWHVVSAGLEMQEYIKKRKIERTKEGKFVFEMRTGVHTGPIVSGVVGVKKFQFDIWGDTVNIASRMQSHGEIDEVNVSGITYELIKDKFDFDFRGLLPVKGKGDMPMYFVKQKESVAAAS